MAFLTFSVLSGDQRMLQAHPSWTAAFCLLAGFFVVNLCRGRSAKFWKWIDLLWICTFLTSLLATLWLHQQRELWTDYRQKVSFSVREHSNFLRFWDHIHSNYCSEEPGDYLGACLIIQSHGQWVKLFSRTEDHFTAFVQKEKNWENPGAPDDYSEILPVAEYYGESSQTAISLDLDMLLKQLGDVAQQVEDLDKEGLVFPLKLDQSGFDLLETRLIEMGLRFQVSAAELHGNTDQLPANWLKVRNLADMVYTVQRSLESLDNLSEFYEQELKDQIPVSQVTPLLFACFVFPFRVGKSFYDIAVERDKEKENTPMPS